MTSEDLKDLIRNANEANPAKVADLLNPIMADRVTDHLATKKIEVARSFISSIEPPKEQEGVLEDEDSTN
jgi:hypothetical protein